jgi:short-subunit dehydrogenase
MMRYRLRPLREQVIVITGASSGIGLATARRAAAAGARLVLVARDAEALEALTDDIKAAGAEAIHVEADVGDAAQVEAAAGRAIEQFGRIDTWINDAGVAIYARLADTPLSEHERLFRTNYFGVVNGTNAALPHLRKSGGALITLGSIASDLPSPLLGAYTASKHAIKGFINSLRIELVTEQAPVSVTLIKPSGTDTPIGRHAANHEGHEALIPPPIYDPELVARAILHAAEHPRREITVGGLGRLNVLLGTHFPRLLDHLAPFLIPALTDPSRPPTHRDNLFAPADEGQVRSGIQPGRRFSLYTWTGRHRAIMGLALIAASGAALLARESVRRRAA